MTSVISCLEALLPLIEFVQDLLPSVISKVLFTAISRDTLIIYPHLPDIKCEMPRFSSLKLERQEIPLSKCFGSFKISTSFRCGGINITNIECRYVVIDEMACLFYVCALMRAFLF